MAITIKLFMFIAAFVVTLFLIVKANLEIEGGKAKDLSDLLQEKGYIFLYILDKKQVEPVRFFGRLYYVSEVMKGCSPLIKIPGKDKDELINLLEGKKSLLSMIGTLCKDNPRALYVCRI